MVAQPKQLISIGGAWVDPREVVAVDATFTDDEPEWSNVRVILKNGHVVFGLRAPGEVAGAVRHPELEGDDATDDRPRGERPEATGHPKRISAMRRRRPDGGDR